MDHKKKALRWDYEKDEMLIELVKTKTQLYDLTSPRYSDNVVKRRSWVEIGSHLGYEGSECKDRWESLRSQYRKRINKKTKSGQAALNNQKWKYEEQMSFLSEFMKDRTRITSLQQARNESEDSDNAEHVGTKEQCSEKVDGEKDDEDDAARRIPLPQQECRRRKRKNSQENNNSASVTLMRYLLEKKKEERDPETIDIFFSLMAATVKKFSPADQHFIKTRVFSLVSEIEGKYIHNQNAQTYVPQTHNICPIPTPSPALSQYSTSSPTST